MKKIMIIAAILVFAGAPGFAQLGGTTLASNTGAKCNCSDVKIYSNMWIQNPAATSNSYVLELQIANKPVNSKMPNLGNCNPSIDSLFFWAERNAIPNNRMHAISDFTKILDVLSTDKKTRTIRLRIMKSFFVIPPVLDQPFGMYYVARMGTKKYCKVFNDFKITDELL